MRGVAERAASHRLTEIQQLAEQAVAQAERAAELESAWRRSRGTQVGRRKRAGAVDSEIDRLLGGLAAHLGALAHGFGDQGVGARASQLMARVLPEGAAAITNMSYENELAAAEVVLRELEQSPAEDAVALGLSSYVERLTGLISDFRQALQEESVREISYDEIRQAQAEGQELMLRVVAKVLGDHGGTGDEETAFRQELLAPVLTQNRRMAERYSNRRGATDVDPETGQEVVDDAATANEPAA